MKDWLRQTTAVLVGTTLALLLVGVVSFMILASQLADVVEQLDTGTTPIDPTPATTFTYLDPEVVEP
jgi:hypothetical protein